MEIPYPRPSVPSPALLRNLAFAGGLGLLAAGCAYDPYTGAYVPCCGPYPTYGYATSPTTGPAANEQAGPAFAPAPPPGSYQDYAQSPPAAPQQGYSNYQPAPGPGAVRGQALAQRFAQANVTHDGRLTLAQAEQAGWHAVARNFAAIDAQGKGYATLEDIRVWRAGRRQAAVPG